MKLAAEQREYLQSNFVFDDFDKTTAEQTEKAMDILDGRKYRQFEKLEKKNCQEKSNGYPA